MHKILTLTEVCDLIGSIDELPNKSANQEFLEDIVDTITNHFGGVCGKATYEEGATDPYWVTIHADDNVGKDSIYEKYDSEGWREYNA